MVFRAVFFIRFSPGSIIGIGYAAADQSRDVGAVYAELFMLFLQNLEATVAVRVDHYSDFGTTTNPKVGSNGRSSNRRIRTAVFGTARPMVWEGDRGNLVTYPIASPKSGTGERAGIVGPRRSRRVIALPAGRSSRPGAAPSIR
jgi:TonB dependent receptor